MHLRTWCLALLCALGAGSAAAVDIDFLFNYYDQDGEHSPVTGGVGTEDLQVVAPVFVVRWAVSDDWTLNFDLGVDSITSASTDNIDTAVSSASRRDSRTYTQVTASRKWRQNQTWRFGASVSNEYDYTSLGANIAWSLDFNQRNTTFTAGLRYFSDTIDLYDIDGVVHGEDDRQTADLSLSLSHVFGPRTVGSVEINYTSQSGYLATPFHEVILAPAPGAGDQALGEHVTERLPDSRQRLAVGLAVNHTFSKWIVQRLYYRYYDDDWGVAAHTVEAETHFRLPTEIEAWIYPILRFHSQSGSDYFGLPGTLTGDEAFFTADRDLSEFTSEKFGIGLRLGFRKKSGFFSKLRSFESRLASYRRDDGLDAVSFSLALGWRF